jgi:RNA polymerase sigma factor (TIGR02999 family)
MSDVTEVLDAVDRGEPGAADRLLPLVYQDLRRLAAARLAREAPGQTLDATALVHEAYMRVAGGDPARNWDGRGHFFAAAAEAMRRILVEAARRKRRLKRGGGRGRVQKAELAAPELGTDPDELLALDEALTRLERQDPVRARLVKLRYFSGLSVPRAAEVLGLSTATAERYWAYARAWLRVELGGREGGPDTVATGP